MSTGDRIVLEDDTTRGEPYTREKLLYKKVEQDKLQICLFTNGGQYTSFGTTVLVTSSTGSSATVKLCMVMKLVNCKSKNC